MPVIILPEPIKAIDRVRILETHNEICFPYIAIPALFTLTAKSKILHSNIHLFRAPSFLLLQCNGDTFPDLSDKGKTAF